MIPPLLRVLPAGDLPAGDFPRHLLPGDTPAVRLQMVQLAMRTYYVDRLWRYRGKLHRLDVTTGALSPMTPAEYRALAPYAIVQVGMTEEGHDTPQVRDVNARTLTDAFNHPGVAPELQGVRFLPWVEESGRIVTTPGYDERTGWYLHWTGDPADPDSVTGHDVGDVIERLTDVAYATGSMGPDWVHHLALLLTPFRMLVGAPSPLGAFLAESMDAGKSLCARVLGSLVLGRVPDQLSLPDFKGELGYTLSAVVNSESPIVWFDNVSTGSTVGGSQLDGLLTAMGRVAARTVRSSELGAGDRTRQQWIMTGNQIDAGPETARRMVPVRLVTRPAGRGFRTPDLVAWVLSDRRRIASVMLRILRDWHEAGSVAPDRVLPSYERWSQLVGGPVCTSDLGRRWWLHAGHRPAPQEHREIDTLCQRWPLDHGTPKPLSAKYILELVDRLGLEGIRGGWMGPARSRETACGIWLRKVARETASRPILGWRIRHGHNGDSSTYAPELEVPGGPGRGPGSETEAPSSFPEPPEPPEPHRGSEDPEPGADLDLGTECAEGGSVPEVPEVPEGLSWPSSQEPEPPARCSEVPAGPLRHRVWEMAERGIRVDPLRWHRLVTAAEGQLSDLAIRGDSEAEGRLENLRLYGPQVFADAVAGDGRVRASWYLQGPGRWSCRDPYLHEITRRYELRSAILPAEGHRLVIGDWRCAHYWIAAGLSGDPVLLEDLERGNLYEVTAEVMLCTRDQAKVALLSILNGSGPQGLATGLGCGVRAAARCRDVWFDRYRVLREYIGQLPRRFTTPLGRLVEVPEDRGPHVTGAWVWQGFEADALALVLDRIAGSPELGEVVFTVYDEAVMESPEARASEAAAALAGAMDAALREVAGLPAGPVDRTVKVESRGDWGKG